MCCGGSHHNAQSDMMSMMLFIQLINGALVDFLCDGKDDENLETKVRAAIKFLGYYPERKRKRNSDGLRDMPKFGFEGEEKKLSYEQLVVTQAYLEKHKEVLREAKKKLRIVLNKKAELEKRKEAAEFCFDKLFLGMFDDYNYCFNFPQHIPQPDYAALIRELSGKKKGSHSK